MVFPSYGNFLPLNQTPLPTGRLCSPLPLRVSCGKSERQSRNIISPGDGIVLGFAAPAWFPPVLLVLCCSLFLNFKRSCWNECVVVSVARLNEAGTHYYYETLQLSDPWWCWCAQAVCEVVCALGVYFEMEHMLRTAGLGMCLVHCDALWTSEWCEY